MYLEAMARDMPTGWYTLREKSSGYAIQERYSKECINWLDTVAKRDGIVIRHAENHPLGEYRVLGYKVDGLCDESLTIYCYHGCYWHGHGCSSKTNNPMKWRKTMEREEMLRSAGFTVVSITSCEWMRDPASKELYSSAKRSSECSLKDIEKGVLDDEIFGLVKFSGHFPDDLKEKYADFPPIFKNTSVDLADIGDHMQTFCIATGRTKGVDRTLIGSFKADGVVVLTSLLKLYLEMGMLLTDVEFVVQYERKSVFKWFRDQVSDDRRRADLCEENGPRGLASKLKGNSGYGRVIMNRLAHLSTSYTTKQNVSLHVNSPLFKNMEELSEGVFEVDKKKRKVIWDLPSQIGLAVYSHAKEIIIRFWLFIFNHIKPSHYELVEMDTDSLYLALACENLDDCIKPEMIESWNANKHKYFVSDDEVTMVDYNGEKVSKKQYEQRTAGLFKVECRARGIVALSSKLYITYDADGMPIKTSCKGTQQKRNNLLPNHYKNVLFTGKSHVIENAGFITRKQNNASKIDTYTHKKVGLSYFYAKRKILADGISTTYLDV